MGRTYYEGELWGTTVNLSTCRALGACHPNIAPHLAPRLPGKCIAKHTGRRRYRIADLAIRHHPKAGDFHNEVVPCVCVSSLQAPQQRVTRRKCSTDVRPVPVPVNSSSSKSHDPQAKTGRAKKVSTATCEPSLNFRQICLKGPSWLYTRLLLSCKVPNGVSNGLLAPTSDLASRL